MRAEKKVTAHSPARIIGAYKLVRDITLLLARKDSWVVAAAMERMTVKYAMNVVRVAHNVPCGIALLGFLKSPDMEAPANIPEVALCVSVRDTCSIPNER
jgi:hypothetical protein